MMQSPKDKLFAEAKVTNTKMRCSLCSEPIQENELEASRQDDGTYLHVLCKAKLEKED